MLVNKTTGEIAYHSIRFKEDGTKEFIQYPLKNNKGEIKFVSNPSLDKLLSTNSPSLVEEK
jgi:hypothetical protein